MSPFAVEILDRAGESLGAGLPRVAAALVLLVVGLVAARIVARVLGRALRAGGLDRLGERWRVHDALERVGIERSLARLVGRAVRVALSFVVLFAALSLLGLEFLSESLNRAVLFLPQLLAALALVLVGVVLGGFVRERVDRLTAQMDLPVAIGPLLQAVVVAVFAVTAVAQVGVPTEVLTVLVNILVAAAALTFTLAFGLGGRDAAREVSAGRYVRGAFEVGQTIAVGDVRGEITAIEPAATVLRAPDGGTVRVPNHLLLVSVVTVEGAAAGS